MRAILIWHVVARSIEKFIWINLGCGALSYLHSGHSGAARSTYAPIRSCTSIIRIGQWYMLYRHLTLTAFDESCRTSQSSSFGHQHEPRLPMNAVWLALWGCSACTSASSVPTRSLTAWRLSFIVETTSRGEDRSSNTMRGPSSSRCVRYGAVYRVLLSIIYIRMPGRDSELRIVSNFSSKLLLSLFTYDVRHTIHSLINRTIFQP